MFFILIIQHISIFINVLKYREERIFQKMQKKCLQGKFFIVVFPYKVNEIDFIPNQGYVQAIN